MDTIVVQIPVPKSLHALFKKANSSHRLAYILYLAYEFELQWGDIEAIEPKVLKKARQEMRNSKWSRAHVSVDKTVYQYWLKTKSMQRWELILALLHTSPAKIARQYFRMSGHTEQVAEMPVEKAGTQASSHEIPVPEKATAEISPSNTDEPIEHTDGSKEPEEDGGLKVDDGPADKRSVHSESLPERQKSPAAETTARDTDNTSDTSDQKVQAGPVTADANDEDSNSGDNEDISSQLSSIKDSVKNVF